MPDLHESERTKLYRTEYRLERAFFYSQAEKHASRKSKDQYKIRESLESRYEYHLRPEDQPSLLSNNVFKNKEMKNGKRNGKGKGTEKEEEARPVFVEKRSSHFIRFDKSEAAVRIEPQKSTSFKIMSRNPFISDTSSFDRADTIPFRQGKICWHLHSDIKHQKVYYYTALIPARISALAHSLVLSFD